MSMNRRSFFKKSFFAGIAAILLPPKIINYHQETIKDIKIVNNVIEINENWSLTMRQDFNPNFKGFNFEPRQIEYTLDLWYKGNEGLSFDFFNLLIENKEEVTINLNEGHGIKYVGDFLLTSLEADFLNPWSKASFMANGAVYKCAIS